MGSCLIYRVLDTVRHSDKCEGSVDTVCRPLTPICPHIIDYNTTTHLRGENHADSHHEGLPPFMTAVGSEHQAPWGNSSPIKLHCTYNTMGNYRAGICALFSRGQRSPPASSGAWLSRCSYNVPLFLWCNRRCFALRQCGRLQRMRAPPVFLFRGLGLVWCGGRAPLL